MTNRPRFDVEKAPPIGLLPRWLWIELRIGAIQNAMARYEAAGVRVPLEWHDELIELFEDAEKRGKGVPTYDAQEKSDEQG